MHGHASTPPAQIIFILAVEHVIPDHLDHVRSRQNNAQDRFKLQPCLSHINTLPRRQMYKLQMPYFQIFFVCLDCFAAMLWKCRKPFQIFFQIKKNSSRQYSYCPSAWPTGPYHLNNRCSSQSLIVTSSRNRSSASTSSKRHPPIFCTKTRRKRPVSVAGHNALARRVHARQNIAARRLSQHLAGRDGGQVRDRLPRGGAHGRARRARPPMLQQSRGARGPANGACSRAGREMLHLEGPVVLIVVGARGRFELRGLRMRRCCAPADKAATDAAVQR